MGSTVDKQKMVSEIFTEYLKGGLSLETTEIIQGWIVNTDSSEETNAGLENIWNRIVWHEPNPSPRAYLMYEKLCKRLELPMTETETETKAKTKRMLFRRRIALRIAAVLIPILLVAGAFIITGRQDQWRFGEFATAGGEQMEMTLPDGTTVWLNENSKLRGEGNRDVRIEGEAYFKVVSSGGSPFAVRSGEMSVIVLGTEFCVEAKPLSDMAQVTLYKGSVKVDISGNEYMLRPEQRFGFNFITGESKVEEAPVRMPEWMGQSMIFERKPLAEIFASLEGIFGVRFVYGSEVAEDRLVTLKLRGSESLSETMFMLSQVSGSFTYEIKESEIMIFGL